jgi:hypothetical protein
MVGGSRASAGPRARPARGRPRCRRHGRVGSEDLRAANSGWSDSGTGQGDEAGARSRSPPARHTSSAAPAVVAGSPATHEEPCRRSPLCPRARLGRRAAGAAARRGRRATGGSMPAFGRRGGSLHSSRPKPGRSGRTSGHRGASSGDDRSPSVRSRGYRSRRGAPGSGLAVVEYAPCEVGPGRGSGPLAVRTGRRRRSRRRSRSRW